MSNQNTDTLFQTICLSEWAGDIDTGDKSDFSHAVAVTDRFDTLAYMTQKASLDAGETLTISPPMVLTSEWVAIAMKVIGTVDVFTDGAVSDGHTYCHGSSYFPGMLILDTKNLSTSIVITGKTDGTVVSVITALVVPATDTRLL